MALTKATKRRRVSDLLRTLPQTVHLVAIHKTARLYIAVAGWHISAAWLPSYKAWAERNCFCSAFSSWLKDPESPRAIDAI